MRLRATAADEMEFKLVMDLTLRFLKAGYIAVLVIQLTGCLDKDDESDADPNTASVAGLSLSFTNPSGADVIATPDIVVNITGTVNSASGVESVTWQNDRGGKGNANGKESWVTGNIVLQLGTNNITISAEDTTGTTVSKTLTVERENTAPTAVNTDSAKPELLFSYNANLSNAAPVKDASILAQPVWFFVTPGSEWTDRGIKSILISCCRGIAGPGEGEGYSTRLDVFGPTWAQQFDLSGLTDGGTRRVRVQATYNDDSKSNAPVFDFTVSGSSAQPNAAPLISGVPSTIATAGVQYSFRPSAQDPNGDTMQYSIVKKPGWANFNRSTGRLYGTPTANDVGRYDDIVISVSDGQASASLPKFSINVEAFGGGSATLTWSVPTHRTDNTPLNNLKGFNVYYGQSSGDYANKIVVNNSGMTNYVVDNLSAGRWYFIVTAVDDDDLESNPSNEGQKVF